MGKDILPIRYASLASPWRSRRDALRPHLDSGVSARIEAVLGSHAAEWRSLLREPNAEIFFEGMLQLGQRLETENRIEAAAQVYTALVQGTPMQQRAQARLDAIAGTGSSAHRAEFLLRRLAHETMEPSTLVGLTAASAAFRMTRLASLSRFVASPNSNFFTRGFGARAAASLMGFGVEATVFPLASRGAAAALGRDLDWSFNQVGREIAGSFIVLGAMKLTGAAAGWASSPAIRRGITGQVPIQQLGMFTGILLGHHLETAVGLRPHLDGATTLIDSLAMLVQFNAAGRLANGIMGEGFRTWEMAMDHQARTLAAPPLPVPLPRGGRGLINEFLLGSRAVLAFTSPLVGEGARSPRLPHILLAEAHDPKISFPDVAPDSASGIRLAPRPAWDYRGPRRLPRAMVSAKPGSEVKQFSYELDLEPLESFSEPSVERVIARRDGREIILKLEETDRTGPLDDFFPKGLKRLSFEVREGEEKGSLVLYWKSGELNLFNVHTRPYEFETEVKANLPVGAGTILMDWVATQAALRGEAFNIISIIEPKIFDILARRQLIRADSAVVEACYPEEVHGYSVEHRGRFGDAEFLAKHRHAHFLNVRAMPNSELIPEEWRTLYFDKEIPSGNPNSPSLFSFQLKVHPLRRVLQPGYEGVIADRYGTSVRIVTVSSGPAGPEDRFFPAHVTKVILELQEGATRGKAAFYLPAGAIAGVNLDTSNMRAGTGTIFSHWLTTQAARENLERHSLYIKNPQILRILSRDGLIDPATTRVELGYWDPMFGSFESERVMMGMDLPALYAHLENRSFLTPVIHLYAQPNLDLLRDGHE